MLFAANTFKKMASEYGKSTPELRNAIRQATTIFIHYIIDFAAQSHQGGDDQRPVTIKPSDLFIALDKAGYNYISRKIQAK